MNGEELRLSSYIIMRKKVKEKKIELKDIWILVLTLIGSAIAVIPITLLGPFFGVIGIILYTFYATIQAMNQKFNLLTIILLYGIPMIIFYVIQYNLRNCIDYGVGGFVYNFPTRYFKVYRYLSRVILSCLIIPFITYIVASIKKIRNNKVGMIIVFIIGLLSFYIMGIRALDLLSY